MAVIRMCLLEPVPGVLLELDGGWMLLDTGFNVPLVRDPFLYRRFHGRNHDIHAELLADERDSLEVAFELVGVDPAEVVVVALSHLHNDHAGGLRWFTERVPVHRASGCRLWGAGLCPRLRRRRPPAQH